MKYSDLTDGIETDLLGVYRQEFYETRAAVKKAQEDMNNLSDDVQENKKKILALAEAHSRFQKVKKKILSCQPKA